MYSRTMARQGPRALQAAEHAGEAEVDAREVDGAFGDVASLVDAAAESGGLRVAA